MRYKIQPGVDWRGDPYYCVWDTKYRLTILVTDSRQKAEQFIEGRAE